MRATSISHPKQFSECPPLEKEMYWKISDHHFGGHNVYLMRKHKYWFPTCIRREWVYLDDFDYNIRTLLKESTEKLIAQYSEDVKRKQLVAYAEEYMK